MYRKKKQREMDGGAIYGGRRKDGGSNYGKEKKKKKETKSEGSLRGRFVRVGLVEVGDELGGVVEFVGREPGCFVVGTFISVALDEV